MRWGCLNSQRYRPRMFSSFMHHLTSNQPHEEFDEKKHCDVNKEMSNGRLDA